MPHYIYILYSDNRDRYYIGSCADLDARLNRHNAGATPSTKSGRPWRRVYYETCADKSEALKREYYLKSMKSRIYLEELIYRMYDSSTG